MVGLHQEDIDPATFSMPLLLANHSHEPNQPTDVIEVLAPGLPIDISSPHRNPTSLDSVPDEDWQCMQSPEPVVDEEYMEACLYAQMAQEQMEQEAYMYNKMAEEAAYFQAVNNMHQAAAQGRVRETLRASSSVSFGLLS